MKLSWLCFVLGLFLSEALQAVPLKIQGPHLLDPQGRIVLLRGINGAGHAKVPPFVSFRTPEELDPLPGWGFNTLRLLFTWEAYEPKPGVYREAYLEHIKTTVRWAAERQIYVLLDFHQDSFSRYLVGGCGEGFPTWTIPPVVPLTYPRNDEHCETWGVRSALSPGMHAAYAAFHRDERGVKSQYFKMLQRVATALRGEPNLIGYDLMNEPWGTGEELKRFHEGAAAAVRVADPEALIFISPQALTSSGIPDVNFERPAIGDFVYAPHFYDPLMFIAKRFTGRSLEKPFAQMRARAKAWGVPWVLAEFGGDPESKGIEDYIDRLYQRLDEDYTGGLQWDYTPQWNPLSKDGWNREDFSVADDRDMLRSNYQPRPYPQKLAGQPEKLWVAPRARAGELWLRLSFIAKPETGATELYIPSDQAYTYRATSTLSCEAKAPGLVCEAEGAGLQTLELWKD